MRIEVIGRNLDITDAIRAHATSKAEKLPKFFDGVTMATFTVAKADHHTKGEFEAELVVHAMHHDNFVSVFTGDDLYGCLDEVVHRAERQLRDFKERLKGGHR